MKAEVKVEKNDVTAVSVVKSVIRGRDTKPRWSPRRSRTRSLVVFGFGVCQNV